MEVSCGGLVLKNAPKKILMVQVKNLKGETVWTFPKGHVEEGESPEQTALREVLEETGWTCEVRDESRPFEKVEYFFMREKQLIKKKVVWFLMSPVAKTGEPDWDEVKQVRWMSLEAAAKVIQYPSDKKLLKKILGS